MTNKLSEWDAMEGNDEPLVIPEPLTEIEETEVVVAKKELPQVTKVDKPILPAMEEALTSLSGEHELIALAMLEARGDVGKASRSPTISHNAMALRAVVKNNPEIRRRYQELLTDELLDKGLHVTERILKMVDLQEKAMGCTVMVEGPDGMEEMEMPADPKMVIELSKEISRLIAEGKNQNMSTKAAVMLTSKEDAKEILALFLES